MRQTIQRAAGRCEAAGNGAEIHSAGPPQGQLSPQGSHRQAVTAHPKQSLEHGSAREHCTYRDRKGTGFAR